MSTPNHRVEVDPLASRLPLYSLPWDAFETLCVRLLESYPDVVQAFRYGVNSGGQEGIDVIGLLRSGQKIGMECKSVRKATPSELTHWIDRLFTRPNVAEFKEFHFAITLNVAKNKRLLEAWAAAVERLAEHGVRTRLWDFSVIEQALSTRPDLIKEFFDEEAAERFGRGAVIEAKWVKQYRKQFEESSGGGMLSLENRSIRMTVRLPTRSSTQLGPIIMFCRSDIKGLAIAVPSHEFVRWMQWTAHASSLEGAPFLTRIPNDRKSMLHLISPVHLYPAEVEHLYWLLKRAWTRYVAAASNVESHMRIGNLHVSVDEGGTRVPLFKMWESFWTQVVEYTSLFSEYRGNSVHHIFTPDPWNIYVELVEARGDLPSGFHVMLPAQREAGVSNLVDAEVTLSWRKSETVRFSEYSPDGVWDAEYAYQWLDTYLLPRVVAYMEAKEGERERAERNRKRGLGRFLSRAPEPQPPSVVRRAPFYESLANPLGAVGPMEIVNVTALKRVADALRRNFAEVGRDHLRVRLEPELLEGVSRVCAELVPLTPDDTMELIGRLIPSKRSTAPPEVQERGRYEVIINALEAMSEMALVIPSLSAERCQRLVEWLEPLAKRAREDRLTMVYR